MDNYIHFLFITQLKRSYTGGGERILGKLRKKTSDGKVSILSLVSISISIAIIAYFFPNSSEVFPNTDVKIIQNFHKNMLKNEYKGSPHVSTNFIKISRTSLKFVHNLSKINNLKLLRYLFIIFGELI